MALDTLGIVRGIIAKCNYTTYSDGSKVPFDGDVPATGDIYSTITLELIGYRDPVTFVFTPASDLQLDIKLWDWTSDEYIFEGLETSLTAINSNPTGDMVMKHRQVPSYVSTDQDYYHTTYGLDAMNSGVSPKIGERLDCSTDALYIDSGTLASTLFKPEEDWFYSDWYDHNGAGAVFVAGRANTNNSVSTALYVSAGNWRVIMGGTDVIVASFDETKAHFVAWKNYWNGSAWVDDLWINGEVVYQNRSTNRGTGTTDLPPLFRARWSTSATTVDPTTQALDFQGGTVKVIRVGGSSITDREMSSLFFKNKNHLSVVINGDSNAVAVSDGTTWPQLLQAEADLYNYHIQYLNAAIAGRDFYATGPESARNGFLTSPSWTGTRPSGGQADQSTDYVMANYYPEMVLEWTTSNLVGGDYFDKNPTPGIAGPEGIGNNAYSDEKQYIAMSKTADYEANGILFYWGDVGPENNTTLVTEDLIPAQDALASMSATLIADTSITNLITIFPSLVNQPTDNTIKAEYNLDGVHYKEAGQLVIAPNVASVVDPIFTATREVNFDPKIIFIDPIEMGTVTEDPAPIEWSHDGTIVNDTEDVDVGMNVVTRSWTNTKGRYSEKSIDVDYVVDPRFDVEISLALDSIDDPGGTPKFLDVSGNNHHMLLLGTPTLTVDNRWTLNPANLDCGYIPTAASTAYLPLNSAWCMAIVIDTDVDNFAAMGICGRSETGFQYRTGLDFYNTNIYSYVGGNSSTLLVGAFQIPTSRTLLAVQNRWTGSAWELDFYKNGVFVMTTATRYTDESTSAPVMIGALSDGGDPTSGTSGELEGIVDNFNYWQRTLSASEHAALNTITGT
jgi:hypothetical protein